MNARPPAVSGMFYSDDRDELRAEILALLDGAKPGAPAKALVAPHAGYVYSGPIAASAFALVRGVKIGRVVVLGPAHRVFVRGLATSGADAFETPLGRVPLDRDANARLEALSFVRPNDRAHTPEHSLEVELPFLQVALGAFALVPLIVGDATMDEVRVALELVWGGPETLVVVSTDLSHHHDYVTARRMDESTARAIVELRPEDIGDEDACGRAPLRGLLALAKARGMRAELLDLRSSGDTAGPRAEVVGYGAFALR